jgi:Zn-dependent protease with chaperone function
MEYEPDWYRHPREQSALVNLRAIKWLERVSKAMVAEDLESDFYFLHLSDDVRMTAGDFPEVHDHLEEACRALGVAPLPDVFLDTRPEPHSSSLGDRRRMIVLSSGLLELLDGDELRVALAHEVAHLACGHSYYQLLTENFSGLAELAGAIPGLAAASYAVRLPLYDWYRKADLSADRGAYLVVRDEDLVLRTIGKLAGGSGHLAERLSPASLRRQAQEVDELAESMRRGGLRDRASYWFSNVVMQGMLRTQPWPAMRAREVQAWAVSERACDLLAGCPPTEPEAPPPDEEDEGRLWRALGVVGDGVEGAGRTALGWLQRRDPPDEDADPQKGA